MPLLRPVIAIILVIRIADAFRIFDVVYVLTGGGPANSTGVLSTVIYRQMFSVFDFAGGAAAAVPLVIVTSLASLAVVLGMGARGAALRAGEFVRRLFVDRIKFNGGIHDSIYAKPQLVDGESIMFAMSTLLHLHRVTKSAEHLEGAVRAGRLVVTWVCLRDAPLPPESRLARYGFRSTGWMACDSPGAGYIHPMGVLAVPDLVELGLASGERVFLKVAELLQAGCNETVALPGKTWGYVAPGLQKEGLLVSWRFADDPMFSGAAFGGRGKGEGNKTCLPWIAAVSVFAHEAMLARHGATDVALIEGQRK